MSNYFSACRLKALWAGREPEKTNNKTGTPLRKKKKANFHIYYFLSLVIGGLQWMVSQGEIVTKRSLGIHSGDDWRPFGDPEVKGKCKFWHLSHNPLVVYEKTHYISTFPLYWEMGVASWATFIFYPIYLKIVHTPLGLQYNIICLFL